MAQARRAYLYTGARNRQELEAWTDSINFEAVLQKVQCPVLIVHGENDELVDVTHAREIVRFVKGKKELKIIPNGDHMCTHALENEVGPYMFDWLAHHLVTCHRSSPEQ